MPIAIHTKYLGPTNTRGARIKATCTRDANCKWTLTVGFDYGAGYETSLTKAARALLAKYAPELQAEALWCCGNTLDNLGYVFAIYPQHTTTGETL